MSRRRKGAAGPTPPAPPERTPRRRGVSPWGLAALAAAVAAALLMRHDFANTPLRRPAAVPDGDPAASLDPVAAFNRALDLGRRGRHVESVPYFRRALESGAAPAWILHRNYAAALHNASLEVRARGRLAGPASRSSIERVALMRASLAEMDVAESLAPDAESRARVADQRGRALELWGLGWDAALEYERAEALEPRLAFVRADAESCLRALGALPGLRSDGGN